MRPILVAMTSAAITCSPSAAKEAETSAKEAIAKCDAYIGSKPTPESFDVIYSGLPNVAEKGEFETTAAFEARRASLRDINSKPVFFKRTRNGRREGLSYDADKGVMVIYPSAFRAYDVSYSLIGSLFGQRDERSGDAIAFTLSQEVISEGSYSAQNGFGAKVEVKTTERRVRAIWERPGKIGEVPFVGQKDPVHRLKLPPNIAKDLIEQGDALFLFTPMFTTIGASFLEANYQRPFERKDQIDVIVGDIQCAFLTDGTGRVAVSFTVK